MAQPFTRTRTTWLLYLLLAFYGYFLNIFGPITPFLKDELSLSYTVSSLHFSAFALGMIGAGLVGYRVIGRLGRTRSLWVGAVGISLGALLLIAGRDPVVTIGASFLMGLVGSLILAIVPSALSDQYGALRAVAFAEGNVISSIVGAAAPALVGWFALTAFGWRAALVTGALAMGVLWIGFRRVGLPPAHAPSGETGQGHLPMRYLIYWVGLVAVVSIEFCMIFWSADYLEIGLGMPKAGAAQAVSLFLVGMIVGRLVSSRLVQRFSSPQVVIGSLVITTAGFLIYWGAVSPTAGVSGLLITGLGVAGLYPLFLSLALGVARESTDRASALASLASGVAIFLLPLILGRLADAVGIRSAYAVIVMLVAVAFVIIVGTGRADATGKQATLHP